MAINAWEVYIKCPFCGNITTRYDYHENTSSDNTEIFAVLNVGRQSRHFTLGSPNGNPVFICGNCGKESVYDDIFTEEYCKVENIDKYKRALINGIIYARHQNKVSFSDWDEDWGEEPALTRLIKMYPKDKDLLALKRVYQNIHSHGTKSVTKYEINTTIVSRSQFILPEVVKKIYFGNNVIVISPHTFEDCTALSDIFLPDSITQIGEYAFANSGLSTIHTSKNIVTIGKRAFANTWISKFFFPDNIKEIHEECFLNCVNLRELWIPKDVSIGIDAFKGCEKLKKIQVANTVLPSDIKLWGLPGDCLIERYHV